MFEYEFGEKKKFSFNFVHHIPGESKSMRVRINGKNKWIKGMTICYILDENDTPLSFGISYCSESESNFSKKRGREIALSRALDIFVGVLGYTDKINKKIRERIWFDYFTSINDKRKIFFDNKLKL